MSREFRPGDECRVTVQSRRVWRGDGTAYMVVEGMQIDGRPVVVIDPGDRERVERLVDIYDAIPCAEGPRPAVTEMQAALRSLIAPPKPEEPQCLGAVVEDAEGVRWTRVEAGDSPTRNPWYPADDVDKQPAEYADIAAVRELAVGIS